MPILLIRSRTRFIKSHVLDLFSIRMKRRNKEVDMKKILSVFLLLFAPSLVSAVEIPLPEATAAKAFVIKSEKYGLWEKTLIVSFPEQRRILSTNEGLVDVMITANHSAHPSLWGKVCKEMKTDSEVGGKVYVRKIQEAIAKAEGIRNEDIAIMATAADMDNLAVVTKIYSPFVVTALVTAGARGNAIRTGVDEGTHIEPDPAVDIKGESSYQKPGTINILILTNARITDGGMARAIITATEAKTAALQDLHVQSTYTNNVQATGTGTDSMIVVSGTTGPRVTYPGGHSRIGELIGKAVYEAVVEALVKQNGFRKEQ
ncbi:MAG: adenosylcobinamide amidohydrolase [Dissulfurispiraceae bacterium]|jgi:adenosylcobinamide amidohydrolase|nr:adenosylcobinamide amidohydrolase [Dissulfurispiraceae bacterium]